MFQKRQNQTTNKWSINHSLLKENITFKSKNINFHFKKQHSHLHTSIYFYICIFVFIYDISCKSLRPRSRRICASASRKLHSSSRNIPYGQRRSRNIQSHSPAALWRLEDTERNFTPEGVLRHYALRAQDISRSARVALPRRLRQEGASCITRDKLFESIILHGGNILAFGYDILCDLIRVGSHARFLDAYYSTLLIST